MDGWLSESVWETPCESILDSIIIICHWHIRICISECEAKSYLYPKHTRSGLSHTRCVSASEMAGQQKETANDERCERAANNPSATSEQLQFLNGCRRWQSWRRWLYSYYHYILYISPCSSGPYMILNRSYAAFVRSFFIVRCVKERARK